MGFFKKAMAKIGIGSVKLDTVIESELQQGAEVTGHFKIRSGKVEQHIDQIYLTIWTTYIEEYEDSEGEEKTRNVYEEIQKVEVPFDETVKPGDEEREIPFSFVLSPKTPISIKDDSVWIDSGLDIKTAIDPSDRDYIKVKPHPYLETVLKAIEELGFKLREIENEAAKIVGYDLPFIQEFEFKPGNDFRDSLDELEVAFFIKDSRIDMLMEVDRKGKGLFGLLEEALDIDESKGKLSIDAEDLEQGVDHVANMLKEYIMDKAA